MTSERWHRVNQLFEQAVDLPLAEKAALLDQACAGDEALRAAVERRLRADAEAGSFLEEPLAASPAATEPDAEPEAPAPERLGPYRILRQIGRGGMGTVYAAERDDDAFHRLVAIKVITASSPDPEIPRRLRAERRILALLEHPNIARIYDGGATDDGAPYLVMEHVDGESIDRYVRRHDLSLAQRVTLLRKVCAAVQYAHRNLVVHRDLKPSNILVTPDGEPKLLDFGIAKVLDPQVLPRTSVETTAPWRRLLTLDYASPEQIRGEPISTASDIYSLGVLLFLLLTGSLPRAFSGLSPWQVEQRLTTTEPPRPSATVVESTVDDEVPTGDPPRLAKRLRGDLDAITLKALRSDPEARYGSAEQLAADLDLYLGGFPVGARRGTWRYRAGKLFRRHRLAVTASAVALLLGLTLLIALAFSRSNLTRSQTLLQEEQTKLQEMLGFFLRMFEDAGPYAAEGIELSLRQAVDRQAQSLEGQLDRQPRVRAAVLSTLGWVYLDLGAADRALDLHQQALELRRASFGDQTLEVAESLDGVAAALRDQWQLDEATATGDTALGLYRQHAADDPRLLLRGLNNRVKLHCLRQEWQAADPLSAEALSLSKAHLESQELEVSRAVAQRALVLGHLGDTEGAIALYSQTLALYEERYGETHPALAPVYNNLGRLAAQADQSDQAVAYWHQADAQYAASFGDDFYDRIIPLTNLGRHLHQLGELEGAEEALRSALDVAVRSPALGPEHEIGYYGRPAIALGRLLAEGGRCPEAMALLGAKVEAWAQRSKGSIVQDGKAILEGCNAPVTTPSPQG
ncbi:MAG: serine/threonine-protein kinase [Acidobacteriota bacterium]